MSRVLSIICICDIIFFSNKSSYQKLVYQNIAKISYARNFNIKLRENCVVQGKFEGTIVFRKQSRSRIRKLFNSFLDKVFFDGLSNLQRGFHACSGSYMKSAVHRIAVLKRNLEVSFQLYLKIHLNDLETGSFDKP